jgi:hypothetical protein
MAGNASPQRVGLIRIRDHCTFSWHANDSGGRRQVHVEPTHCRECVTELEKLGYDVSGRQPNQ